MEKLFCCSSTDGKYITLQLLKFYAESGYVMYKSITGDLPQYFSKELKNFRMEGHLLKDLPEFTFLGAYSESGDKMIFKVENEITDTSDSYAQKDVLTFKGTMISENEIHLTKTSKRTNFSSDGVYLKMTDAEVLNLLK